MTFVLPDRERMKGLQAVRNTERKFIPSINKHALRVVSYFLRLTSRCFNCNKEVLAYVQAQPVYAAHFIVATYFDTIRSYLGR